MYCGLPVLIAVVGVIVAALVGPCGACNVSLNTDSRGRNPYCPFTAPYCYGSLCVQCNPDMGDDICDCGNGLACNQDFSSPTVAYCTTPPKYGQSCSVNSDCFSNFNGGVQVALLCISGTCRQCDPTSSQPVQCTYGYLNGTAKYCAQPGIWSNTSSSGPTATATATAGPGPSPTSSGGSLTGLVGFLRDLLPLLFAILLVSALFQ